MIPFHIQRHKDILNDCKNDKDTARLAEISFATKFIATYLFIKVKGTRPMTYQYLTSDMIKQAKKNGGYIDQKMFKTAAITDLILWLLIKQVYTAIVLS